ncbi:MAG: hypothetical protein U0359_07555 [Byssovorax sp.]
MKVRAKLVVNDRVLDEFKNEHLSPGAMYTVIGLDDEHFRVLNDRDEPVLYPKFLFDVVDSRVPKDWVRREDADGAYYVDPIECAIPGFYEDYFDGRPAAVAAFQAAMKKMNC